MPTTSAHASLWLADEAPAAYPSLTGDQDADVAVIGGGIAGVTTALRLAQHGASVILLEARSIASGVTGCTTAKVSALQSTLLSTIAARHGTEAARIYAEASAAAVEDVARYVLEAEIDCACERRPAVTYAAGRGRARGGGRRVRRGGGCGPAGAVAGRRRRAALPGRRRDLAARPDRFSPGALRPRAGRGPDPGRRRCTRSGSSRSIAAAPTRCRPTRVRCAAGRSS